MTAIASLSTTIAPTKKGIKMPNIAFLSQEAKTSDKKWRNSANIGRLQSLANKKIPKTQMDAWH